jgi:putative selenium metabolism protein SsnA
MSTILIKNGIIATLGEDNQVLYDHSLLIDGDKISRIAPKGEFTGNYDKEIDAHGKVVMPGFICNHMHFYSSMVKGLGKAEPAVDFVDVLHKLWWRLDKQLTLDDCYYSALLPCVDAIKRGTTTFIDHHASPFAVTGSLDKLADAITETGLRGSLCYELSDRDGETSSREGHEENIRFIKKCQSEKSPFLSAMYGMHASFTINDESMERAAEAANALGAGFHCHCAEAESDQVYNQENFGLRVIERLKKYNMLGPKSLAIHCVRINENEMEILRDTDTPVIHNPQSNTNNAVGTAEIIKMNEKGLLVGLGTDAMTVNMLEEVRHSLFIHHLAQDNPSVGFMESLNALLVNNAKIANRHFDADLGVLAAGKAADVILMDYFPPTPFDANSFYGHVGFGLSQSFVDTTIVAGRILMENKKLTIDIDEEEIAARSQELAAKLWERF